MAPSDNQPDVVRTAPEETVNDFLTDAELSNTPQLARLYTDILREGSLAIETVKTDLDMPHSTTDKYVGRLEEMDLLTRHEDETSTRVSVVPIHVLLETEQGEVAASPTLVDAIGRQLDTEDFEPFSTDLRLLTLTRYDSLPQRQ